MTRKRRGGSKPRGGGGGKGGGGRSGKSGRRGGDRQPAKPARVSPRDRSLAAFFGLSVEPPDTLTQRVDEALSDVDVLRAAVARLDPVARATLYELVSSGGFSEKALAERLSDLRGMPPDAVRDACRLLQRHALAGTCGQRCRDVHPIHELDVLRIDALAFTARAIDAGPEPLSFAFRVALVAAYAAQTPPGLTKDGYIYVRWRRKAAAQLAHPSLPSGTIETIVNLLLRSGALIADEEAGQSLLHLDVERACDLVTHSTTDLALAILARSDWQSLSTCDVTLAALERARATSDAPGFVSWIDLRDAASVLATLPWPARHPRAASSKTLPALAFGVGGLRQLGLVESAYRDGDILVRRLPETEPAPELWSVLPNLDVLVPTHAAPSDVIRLGCIATVAGVDQVTRFTLGRGSVQRGTLLLGDATAQGVLDMLASGAAHPIPDGVAANIRSWLGSARPAAAFVGAVVMVDGDEQAAALLRAAPAARRLAPGVYGLDAARLAKVLRALEKEGIPVAPTQRADAGPRTRFRGTFDLAEAAHTERAELEKYASTAVGGPPPQGHASLRDLEQRAPHVWRAVRGLPELLERAAVLTTPELARLQGKSDNAVRALVAAEPVKRAPSEPDAELLARILGSSFGELLGDGFDNDDDDDFGDIFGIVDAPDPDAVEAESVWETLSLGKLRTRLREASDEARPIDLMYSTASGGHEAHLVLPSLVTVQGRREIVRAVDLITDRERRFFLDRIVAVREADSG